MTIVGLKETFIDVETVGTIAVNVLETNVTSTCERALSVCAVGVFRTIISFQETLIDVETVESITFETNITCTVVVSDHVNTRGIVVTFVAVVKMISYAVNLTSFGFGTTFIRICAVEAITEETIHTSTIEAARGVVATSTPRLSTLDR